jgi:dinuclear metal center YbgI/SA1388 family protein
MPVLLAEVVQAARAIAPPELAEPWDNVGLLVGDPGQEVTRVLLAVDLTSTVAEEARDTGCHAVLAYHPVIFHPLKTVTSESLVFRLVRDGVGVYAFHTALDVVDGGTNDVLADVLGLQDRRPLRPRPGAPGSGTSLGLGRVGSLQAASRAALVERVKTGLGLGSVLVAGPTDGPARRGAVGAGACGDLVRDAIREGVDLYLTGELRHHDALLAAAAGVTVVCTLHSHSERAVLEVVRRRLGALLPQLETRLSHADQDPFRPA